jgi:hypothetical protein
VKLLQSTEKERREAGVISMGAYARLIDRRRSLTGRIDMYVCRTGGIPNVYLHIWA